MDADNLLARWIHGTRNPTSTRSSDGILRQNTDFPTCGAHSMNGASWKRISDSSFPSCRGLRKEILANRKSLSCKASWTPQGVIKLRGIHERNEPPSAQDKEELTSRIAVRAPRRQFIVPRMIRLLTGMKDSPKTHRDERFPEDSPLWKESLSRLQSQKRLFSLKKGPMKTSQHESATSGSY